MSNSSRHRAVRSIIRRPVPGRTTACALLFAGACWCVSAVECYGRGGRRPILKRADGMGSALLGAFIAAKRAGVRRRSDRSGYTERRHASLRRIEAVCACVHHARARKTTRSSGDTRHLECYACKRSLQRRRRRYLMDAQLRIDDSGLFFAVSASLSRTRAG